MPLTVLAVGDVVSDAGVDYLARHLPSLQRLHRVDFTVVNGENAAGTGLLPRQADDILSAGADVITLGNHTYGRHQIFDRLDDDPRLLRPANYAGVRPGRGWGVFPCGGYRVGVLNLIGRCSLEWGADNPFLTADKALKDMAGADFLLVDFHAEATSEKLAMAHDLDGRAAALWGTHTHVPTADARIFPGGLGYITDLGMTGPADGVIGIRAEQSVTLFRGGLPGRFEPAKGPCKLEACLFTLDGGRCTGIEQILIRD
ncbi:MAG: YmdB family metallophosphoesterase [Oscillospiraceae bacterium]|nr:YmdB family metallophosphoesterase [Oscillospiraceae bacterium]